MSTFTIIAIAFGVVILVLLVAAILRQRANKREQMRAMLDTEAAEHRQEADANVERARELKPEADRKRVEAGQHEQAAAEHERAAAEHQEAADSAKAEAQRIDERARSAGNAAARHDSEAAEREERSRDLS